MTTLTINNQAKVVSYGTYPEPVLEVVENFKIAVTQKYLTFKKDIEDARAGIKAGEFSIFSVEKILKKVQDKIKNI